MGTTTGVTSQYCCLVVQQMLERIVGSANYPANTYNEKNGFLKAVISPENTNGFEQIQTTSRFGKGIPSAGNRKVEIAYAARVCAAVTDGVGDVCDTGTVYGDDLKYATADVTFNKTTSLRISKEDFRQLCEEPNSRLERAITNRVADLKKAVNNELITAYIAALGNYYTAPGGVPVDSGAAPKSLILFNSNAAYGLAPNGLAFTPVMSDYQRSGFSGEPIMVGGDMFSRFSMAQKVFAGNMEGADPAKLGMPQMWSDYAVDTIFADGSQHILSWVPGYVQLLEWYAYPAGSIYEQFREDYQTSTMTMGDFSFDFTSKYDPCNGGYWDLTFTKVFDLFTIPNDAFSAACDQDSNGILQWLATCDSLDCTYTTL